MDTKVPSPWWRRKSINSRATLVSVGVFLVGVIGIATVLHNEPCVYADDDASSKHSGPVEQNAVKEVIQGRQVFRFDTFGDEAFWGDTLNLHLAVQQLT